MDIEWNPQYKAIEGTLSNNLTLNQVDIDYDRIRVSYDLNGADSESDADLNGSILRKIEDGMTNAVVEMFENQIEKLLHRVVKVEIEKILSQINQEVPRFEIGFGNHHDQQHRERRMRVDADHGADERKQDVVEEAPVTVSKDSGPNKLMTRLRQLKAIV